MKTKCYLCDRKRYCKLTKLRNVYAKSNSDAFFDAWVCKECRDCLQEEDQKA